jgi:spoIIIJ-associated protein
MEWVETTGRSIDEAKDLALDRLGVDEHDAEFEVLEEPRPGLFGRVRGQARVRARVRPTQPRPKLERRDRRRRRDDGTTAAGAAAAAKVGVPAQARDDQRRADEPAPSSRRDANRRTDGPSPREPQAPAAPMRPLPPHEEITMTDGTQDVAQVQAGAVAFLQGLLDAFGLTGRIETNEPADGEIEVTIEGEDLGLLVGPKGQTLLAIQDLTRLVAQRRITSGSPRLGVDVAGYRQRRVEALRRFSHQLAEQVRQSGAAKALEPMSAVDRKVVHDALTEAEGVTTMSEGEEPYRRVVIVPSSST